MQDIMGSEPANTSEEFHRSIGDGTSCVAKRLDDKKRRGWTSPPFKYLSSLDPCAAGLRYPAARTHVSRVPDVKISRDPSDQPIESFCLTSVTVIRGYPSVATQEADRRRRRGDDCNC